MSANAIVLNSTTMPFVNAVNIFVLGPLFVYVGLKRPRIDIPYFVIYAVGLLTVAFYGYALLKSAIKKESISKNVYLFAANVLLAGPLMIYVGAGAIHFKFSISTYAFMGLVLVGVITMAYNAYELVVHVKRDFYARSQ